ncbi:MAG: endolytic transglycosylase MltG [Bacteroidales bacterium]|nr:endolytic transglycosylase MltG [Bacteroidales bacterium]
MSITSRHRRIGKWPLIIMAIIAIVVLVCGIWGYRFVYKSVIDLGSRKQMSLYLPQGVTFDELCQLLELDSALTDRDNLSTVASLMGAKDQIRHGHYKLRNGMSARQLMNLLRSGNQSPIRVTFNNCRTLAQVAGKVSHFLEADSLDILAAMEDKQLMAELGFNENSIPALYLPNTYEMFWTASGEDWVRRMKSEYDKFWNAQRMHKADSIGLSPKEVVTLASIVEEETNKVADYPIIAGLYLNRIRKGMLLQACPTLKYCKGDFTIRRVLNSDKEIDHPYNTYKYPGLPPGPIRVTTGAAIDAVLNADDNDYLFMCARPDYSGLHNFARTVAQHERNAREYQAWLNTQKIYR